MPKTIIECENIVKNYQLGPVLVQALKGISFKIEEGELVAIVGSSGCGKSTLMNILGLLDRATSGVYRVDGKEVKDCTDDELSRLRNLNIGFVFQSYNLLSRLNVLENVCVPLEYRNMPTAAMHEAARVMLKRVLMDNREHHRPNELSGGQQQRVAIARALAGKPSLLLADEPTGALDTKTSDEVMKLFVELNRKEGITVVIITHDPDLAAQCDRQIVLSDGFILKDKRRK